MESLRHVSKGGTPFHVTVKAARLVPDGGQAASLPPPIGTMPLVEVVELERYGFAPQRTCGTPLRHFFMVVERRHVVERHGRQGVALYFDNQRSGPCLSVTSVNGRNAMAPLEFDGVATPSPAATLGITPRIVITADGVERIWHPARFHGYYGPAGEFTDWQDGVPVRLKDMYTPQGEVAQYIWVPSCYEDMGVAEQTLDADDLTRTLSIALWFPRPEFVRTVTTMCTTAYRSSSPFESLELQSHGSFGFQAMGAQTRGGLESAMPAVEDLKMAAGGKIRQGFPLCPLGTHVFPTEPEVVLVFHPVTETRARDLGLIEAGRTAPYGRINTF